MFLIIIYLDAACKIDMMYDCNALIYFISIQHLFSIAIDTLLNQSSDPLSFIALNRKYAMLLNIGDCANLDS